MSLDSAGSGMSLGGGTDPLSSAFFPLYQRLFDEDGDFVSDVEQKLIEARMSEAVEWYLSRSLGVGVIVGVVLWLLGVLLGFTIVSFGLIETGAWLGLPVPHPAVADALNALKIPFAIFFTGLILGSLGFAGGLGMMISLPYLKAGERNREINMLLPDAIAFMYALSIGGLNQLEILEAMAKAEDTYSEVSKEFQSIVQETEYFDTDYRNAIQKQAMETPSTELSQFLTDMLSIVNSGGDMTGFLSDKKDKHMRTAKQQQELTLDTLELFGEMYMTLSLFPLLMIIILVIMSMMGQANDMMLYGTVYGLVPIVGVAFLILISTVKEDEPGDGYLELDKLDADETDDEDVTSNLIDVGIINDYAGTDAMFDHIRNREGRHKLKWVFNNPHLFFRDNPVYVLGLTIPISLILITAALLTGSAPTSTDDFISQPVWSTFVYVYMPLYVNCLPLAVFREWNVLSRRSIISKLSDNLRKLASANETGQTLLESTKTVSDTSSGKLSDEFEMIYTKVNYGTSLKQALIEFNNKYHIPRLSRTIKLISKAQEASSQITSVLSTAAQASENQDDIDRERKSRTRMQVVIIIMTYVVLLAVMAILQTQFLDTMAGVMDEAPSGGDAPGGGAALGMQIDVDKLSMMFFHAVTMQAIMSSFIAGYMQEADLMAGVKLAVILPSLALGTWIVI